jgi:hypothetical protein
MSSLLQCIQTASASDKDRHILSAAELSGLFHSRQAPQEDRGVYFAVVSQILLETGLSDTYEIIVMPMKRAKLGFINHEFACYAPGLGTFDSQVERSMLNDVLLSKPLNQAIVRVISAKNKPMVKGVDDIKSGSLISMIRGAPLSVQMQDMVNKAGDIVFVNSERENIRMLINQRVDYLFLFYPDAISAYKNLGITEHFPYATQFSPLIIDDNIICHPEFIADFNLINDKIEQYQNDGTLKRILGNTYIVGSQFMNLNQN